MVTNFVERLIVGTIFAVEEHVRMAFSARQTVTRQENLNGQLNYDRLLRRRHC